MLSSLEDILYWQGTFPDDAIAHLIDQEETSKVLLRACLTNTHLYHKELTEDYVGALYAAYILAFFRDEMAFNSIVELLKLPAGYPELIFKEFLIQSFPRVLASCYNGNKELLFSLLVEEKTSLISRLVGLVALSILYRVKKVKKEELLELYKRLLSHPLEASFLAAMAEEIADLHLHELEDEITSLYQKEMVAKEQFSLADFTKLLHSEFSNPTKFFLVEDVFEELTGKEYKQDHD
jgi:hypothetical protein